MVFEQILVANDRQKDRREFDPEPLLDPFVDPIDFLQDAAPAVIHRLVCPAVSLAGDGDRDIGSGRVDQGIRSAGTIVNEPDATDAP